MPRVSSGTTDPFDTDKEKRALAEARTAEAQARAARIREGLTSPNYPGFSNLATATAAETARERAATNKRLTDADTQRNQLEALKAMSAAAMPGSPHNQAALDAMAKMAGVTVPKAANPEQEKANKIRAARGLPPLAGTEEAQSGPIDNLVAPAPPAAGDETLFRPSYAGAAGGPAPGTTPVPTRPEGEPSLGSPITPHLGTGGALITPENPTGQPTNPWGQGGLFYGNPTNIAAANVRAREAAMYPFGPVSPGSRILSPNDPMARLAAAFGGRPAPTPVTTPTPAPAVARNIPPNEDVMPTLPPLPTTGPVAPSRATGNVLPPSPVAGGVGGAPAPTPAARVPGYLESPFNIRTGFAPGANPMANLHTAILQGMAAQNAAEAERQRRMQTPGVSIY